MEHHDQDQATARPWPKRGDILMARPLFHHEQGHWPLAHKEHPVLVLKVAQRNADPDSPVMAIVVPLSHAPSSQHKANHLPVADHQVKKMMAHPGKQSHICTDSPNIIVLNGEENGMRAASWTPDWASPYAHGRITDEALIDAAEALTKTFLAETRYQPPIQGRVVGEAPAPTRHKVGIDLHPHTRISIVRKAAEMEAKRAAKSIERLGTALLRAGLSRPQVDTSMAIA